MQKFRGKSPEFTKNSLTRQEEWCTMEVHTVIICPFVPILIYNDIIPQEMAVVKR